MEQYICFIGKNSIKMKDNLYFNIDLYALSGCDLNISCGKHHIFSQNHIKIAEIM